MLYDSNEEEALEESPIYMTPDSFKVTNNVKKSPMEPECDIDEDGYKWKKSGKYFSFVHVIRKSINYNNIRI